MLKDSYNEYQKICSNMHTDFNQDDEKDREEYIQLFKKNTKGFPDEDMIKYYTKQINDSFFYYVYKRVLTDIYDDQQRRVLKDSQYYINYFVKDCQANTSSEENAAEFKIIQYYTEKVKEMQEYCFNKYFHLEEKKDNKD